MHVCSCPRCDGYLTYRGVEGGSAERPPDFGDGEGSASSLTMPEGEEASQTITKATKRELGVECTNVGTLHAFVVCACVCMCVHVCACVGRLWLVVRAAAMQMPIGLPHNCLLLAHPSSSTARVHSIGCAALPVPT